mmetsp:Transcript_81397/g.231037  ORF Transcript_81397/g.231037 Transcript_81397/m.231037 type:complete len:84 (-) Transcript_81397:257-508(-)
MTATTPPRHHATTPPRHNTATPPPCHTTVASQVMKMSLGEKAELTCPGDYAYGEFGNPTCICPPQRHLAERRIAHHPKQDRTG